MITVVNLYVFGSKRVSCFEGIIHGGLRCTLMRVYYQQYNCQLLCAHWLIIS
jgi:hypothetical protein